MKSDKLFAIAVLDHWWILCVLVVNVNFLHKNCAKIHHLCHRKHSLILIVTAAAQPISCKVCQRTDEQQSFYRCSPCNFDLHVECFSPSPVIDASHEHPFTCKLRQQSFICDACGTPGDCAPYECHTCNLVVHKKCNSLPHTFKIKRHHHPLSHAYFLEEKEFQSWECKICHKEVNSEHGSYSCSDCNYVVHVDCAMEMADLDGLIEPKKRYVKPHKFGVFFDESITYTVGKEIQVEGQKIAAEILHFSHAHDLILSNEIGDDKRCHGCTLSFSASFYGCSAFNFFLHKSCAELPREKYHWLHEHLLTLRSDTIFKCNWCYYESSGFFYYCGKCEMNLCPRCGAVSEDHTNHPGHEHPLLFYHKYEGKCSACGDHIDYAFKCKSCNFALDIRCLTLQHSVRHKCDRHPITLTYDDDDYPLKHYCDICEEARDPNQWYYHRGLCDKSVHRECVLGKYPFIRLGGYYRSNHPHLLAFIQKIYEYPECFACGKPCYDLALECTEFGCHYIVHWECIKPLRLCFTGKMGRKGESSDT